MPNDSSARLDLPYVAAGQLQKHVTINQALTRLDALVHAAVASRTIDEQPDAAADGTLYILPAGATGADWSARSAGDLVRADSGGWTPVPVPDGLMAVVLDTGALILRRDGGWAGVGSIDALGRLGLNTTADAVNPFAARINKALWTALEAGAGGDGDLRMTFNKEGSADVLSLLFQSGFGGRAELGLIGDDDLTLKVSADGNTWHEALRVDRHTGRLVPSGGAARCQTTVRAASGPYAVPVWARRLEVVAIGGGGGGGSGAAGSTATSRFGGGGGGAGGISIAGWDTAHLPAVLQITIGAAALGGSGVGSGVGQPGFDGQPTTVGAGASVILKALGGIGGQGGSTTSGLGGAGGAGLVVSNGGGDSSVTLSGRVGRSTFRPDGSGGGGGGGGLDSAGVARAGGAGGVGGMLAAEVAGGLGGSGASGEGGYAPAAPALGLAAGGGGGGAASVTTGHAGGDGGVGGAGGGGGGAGFSASGAGGQGGAGRVLITALG